MEKKSHVKPLKRFHTSKLSPIRHAGFALLILRILESSLVDSRGARVRLGETEYQVKNGFRPVNTQNIREQPCRQPRCSREAWRGRISSEKLVYALAETLRLPTMDFFAHRICDSCDRLARSLHFSSRSAGRLFQISSRVANARTGQRRRLECGGFQRTAVDQK